MLTDSVFTFLFETKVHPSKQYFAVGEKGDIPNIVIYEYPSLRPYRILKGGTQRSYAYLDFK